MLYVSIRPRHVSTTQLINRGLQYKFCTDQCPPPQSQRMTGETGHESSEAIAMDARPPKIECPAVSEHPEPTDPGRVFHAKPVAPRDAAELVTEQLAHGGGPGVVDEVYDTRVKIGEALQAAGKDLEDQPIERSDAAAEACAVGAEGMAVPGRVTERAQAAAEANASAEGAEDKVTVADILRWEATMKLPKGKAVTREVAAAAAAEAKAANDPGAATKTYGVSAALDMAAKHNADHERASLMGGTCAAALIGCWMVHFTIPK